MDPVILRFLIVLAILAGVVAVGRWWQHRDGQVRQPGSARLNRHQLDAVGLDLSDGSSGALLLGSPTCAPCDSVKRVLGDIEGERSGFRWVYADAADHLDLAQEHRVLRVPTVLMVTSDGSIVARSTGVPRHEDLRRVLDADALDSVA